MELVSGTQVVGDARERRAPGFGHAVIYEKEIIFRLCKDVSTVLESDEEREMARLEDVLTSCNIGIRLCRCTVIPTS